MTISRRVAALTVLFATAGCSDGGEARNASADELERTRAEVAATKTEVLALKAEIAETMTTAKKALAEAEAATASATKAARKAEAAKSVCSAEPHTPKPGFPRVEMGKAGMKINGTLLPKSPKLEDLEKLLGKARVDQHLRIFDKAGIVAWVDETGKVGQVSLFLAQTGFFFAPNILYAGQADFNGRALHARSAALNETLEGGLTLSSDTNDEGCLATVGIGFLD